MIGFYKKVIIFNIIALILSLSVGGWIVYKFNQFIHTRASSEKDKVYIEINRGENLYSIIKKLKKFGVITRSDWFYYYIKLTGDAKKIKAGTHFFYTDFTPKEVLKELISISIYSVKVVVIEGSDIDDIADTLQKSGYDRQRFLQLVNDKNLAEQLTGLKIDTLEGFLYPDTYYLEKHEKVEKIVSVMVNRFKDIFQKIAKKSNFTQDDYKHIIIASIIEKETSKKKDMPFVASVIYNRLRLNMPLQMDSTIIYGIKNFDGNLTKKDLLDSSNVYNTYIYKGLPKTPICNPSKSAIYAAYNPKKTDYLYFVSKDGKNTVFSRTLREHNRWVIRYQKRH